MASQRRGAPRASAGGREPLSRGRIVAAGLALAEREGLERLTLRRLATELGAKPMSIYTHVRDKDELLDAMYAALLERVLAYPPQPSWQEELLCGARALRRTLGAQPSLMPLLLRHATPPTALALSERALRGMLEAGFAPEEALRAFRAASSYALGYVLFEGSLDPAAHRAYLRDLLTAVPAQGFPALHRILREVDEPDQEAVFELGLRALVTGLERETAGSGHPADKPPGASHSSKRAGNPRP